MNDRMVIVVTEKQAKFMNRVLTGYGQKAQFVRNLITIGMNAIKKDSKVLMKIMGATWDLGSAMEEINEK